MPEEKTNSAEDPGLLGRIRSGDEAAFDELVRLYQKDVYRLAYRFCGNAEEADDLAQETFLRAYRSLPRFRGDASLRTWLLKIAANLSLNLVQSARISRREEAPVEDLAPPVYPTAESSLIAAERKKLLGPAIDALPPRQKATLLLRIEAGLKFREIAETMGCSTGTAKANFFHAVASLKLAMKDLA